MIIEDLFPEVLGLIFQECSLLDPDSPYHLSQVSKAFLNVVRHTPAAWTQLRLRAIEGPHDPISASKVDVWFNYSTGHAIDVNVDVQASSTPESGFFLKDIAPPVYGTTRALKSYTNRIQTLSVSAVSECDARAFINALYEDPPSPFSANGDSDAAFALSSLVTQVSSTAPPTSFASSIPLPHLPYLKNLKLVNHSIAFLEGRRFEQLCHLSITRPVRFVPFSLCAVLDILRCAPVLRTLSIESRIRDDADDGHRHEYDSDSQSRDRLIHLPYLTSLSLRTNVAPSILSSLLLPRLTHLRVDDLNGKQRARSRETAAALKKLLVRMEMPMHMDAEDKREPGGLGVLDLLNIDVCLKDDPRMHSATDVDASWEWCFGRMRTLERVCVTGVDGAALVGMLGSPRWAGEAEAEASSGTSELSFSTVPSTSRHLSSYPPMGSITEPSPSPSSSSSSSSSRSTSNRTPVNEKRTSIDFPCPNLRSITLCNTSVPPNLGWFEHRRPGVSVEVDGGVWPFTSSTPSHRTSNIGVSSGPSSALTHDASFTSRTTGSDTDATDFLSLYTDLLPRPSIATTGVAANKQSAAPRVRWQSGPWVVLGHQREG